MSLDAKAWMKIAVLPGLREPVLIDADSSCCPCWDCIGMHLDPGFYWLRMFGERWNVHRGRKLTSEQRELLSVVSS